MPRDSGRTGTAGNKKGTPAKIMIAMKDPMKHLGGGGKKLTGKGGKSGRHKGY